MTKQIKITTAEIPDEEAGYESAIKAISLHVNTEKPDLVVLPEMPFTPWIFTTDKVDTELWDNTVNNHSNWLNALISDLNAPLITSRPTSLNGKHLNQAIYIDKDRNIHPLRSKFFLPNEYPAVEVPWFDSGDSPDQTFQLDGLTMGIQLCSEILYAEIPRLLGMKAAQLIIQPRATGDDPRWRAAALLAAATSGTFVIGANRRSSKLDWFTGASWVYAPKGALLAETSQEKPVISIELDLSEVTEKQSQYPSNMFAHYGV